MSREKSAMTLEQAIEAIGRMSKKECLHLRAILEVRQKELAGEPLTLEEQQFIDQVDRELLEAGL